jgi:hypothetical protein
VIQKRFPILVRRTPNLSVQTQIDLVIALCGLHNFLMDNGGGKDRFGDVEHVDGAVIDDEDEDDVEIGPAVTDAEKWREEIAIAMWEQYQQHLANI